MRFVKLSFSIWSAFVVMFSNQSLDYDVCENILWVKEQEGQKNRFSIRKDFARWIISLLVGFLTALIGCFIAISIEEISYFKYSYLQKGKSNA